MSNLRLWVSHNTGALIAFAILLFVFALLHLTGVVPGPHHR